MKKNKCCKYCKTTKDLYTVVWPGNKQVVMSVCNSCRGKNISKGHKKAKESCTREGFPKSWEEASKNKKCKCCNTTKDLFRATWPNEKYVVMNVCKTCRGKNITKGNLQVWSDGTRDKSECNNWVEAGKKTRFNKNDTPWNKDKINYFSAEARKKQGDSRRDKTYEEIFGIEKASEMRERIRNEHIARIKQCKLHGLPLTPFIGKNETKILNTLEKNLTYKIERQHKVAGYFLDGYCSILNLVIEVNEGHHFNVDGTYTAKHLYRKEQIIKKLNCQWLDITDTGGNKNECPI